MSNEKPLKVCVVVASRANYGRIKTVLKAIKEHPNLELQLICGASVLLTRYGSAIDIIRADGFEPDRTIHYIVEGENLVTQAKTTGLGIIELSTAFQDLDPDYVLTVADRYETMANAIAATYCNIPLIHVQGGEVSGNIDDRVRHAITKLADLHFPCTEESRQRIIKMGEDPSSVFFCGCPAIDIALSVEKKLSNEYMSKYSGVGSDIDWTKPYILLLQHPVTTSFGDGFDQIQSSLHAIKDMEGYQKIVLWPNVDAGSDSVSKGIRVFREQGEDKNKNFHYFRNFSPEDYIKVIGNAACCIGNSSSFIREGAALGIPAVVIGDRQIDREHGPNVKFSSYEYADIKAQVEKQLEHGFYEHSPLFGSGQAGQQIADIISNYKVPSHKRMTY